LDQYSPSIGGWQASRREVSGTASGPDWNCAEQSPTFSQVQQMLGEDCLPDAEFFVRCWTVGAARAADDLWDRNRMQRERESQSSPFWNFSMPRISAEEFVQNQSMHVPLGPSSQAAAWPYPNPAENENSGPDWDGDFDPADPLTIERARRLLGVAANSSPAQIKGAYRHLARIYHPDRLDWKSSQARQIATDRMTAINKAYVLLGSGRSTQLNGSRSSSC
jgi:DnaJ-domain-containing protein 1